MSKSVFAAFDLQPIRVPLEKLLPTRALPEGVKESKRYKTIAMSIAEVGLIEPLVVHAPRGQKGTYLLLDGHVRLEALKELGEKEVTCLLAIDDEGYTYNHKVNRLAPIQATKMIQKALREGVSTERIAKALNLSASTIAQTQSLLTGICTEAIDILKDRPIGESALRFLKWVKPLRQIEMAELMVSSGNYSVSYARALATTSARDQLVSPEIDKKRTRLDELKKHEHEIETLQRDFKMVDQAYGRDVLHLTVFQGYVKKLLGNQRVARFLSQKYPEYLGEFRAILDAESLDG